MKKIVMIMLALFLLSGCVGMELPSNSPYPVIRRSAMRSQQVQRSQPAVSVFTGKTISIEINKDSDWQYRRDPVFQDILTTELLVRGVTIVNEGGDYTLIVAASDYDRRKMVTIRVVDASGKIFATGYGKGEDLSFGWDDDWRVRQYSRKDWLYQSYATATQLAVKGLFGQ